MSHIVDLQIVTTSGKDFARLDLNCNQVKATNANRNGDKFDTMDEK